MPADLWRTVGIPTTQGCTGQVWPAPKTLYLNRNHRHSEEDNDHHPINARLRGAEKQDVPMNKLSIVKEFWDFLKTRKKWWLIPIVVFLLALGVILVGAKGSALAPFIYSLF